MKTYSTKSKTRIIQLDSGRSNVYFIQHLKARILVDTSTRSNYAKINNKLVSLIPPDQGLDYLILTHTHFDHCQNAQKIKQEYKCRLVMSAFEDRYVNKGYTTIPKGTMGFSRILSGIGRRLVLKATSYTPFNPDILVSNQKIKLPEIDGIEIIPTPGHSEGSISILIDREIALVGDALFGIFKNSCFPPFADDVKELIQSWKVLLDTECKSFFPGHGRAVSRKQLEKEYSKRKEPRKIPAAP